MHDQDQLPPLRSLPLMTPWYGPKALAQTGLRSIVSHTIGGYADQRILQASADRVSPARLTARYDYSLPVGAPSQTLARDADGAIWIDYAADTGDGFDSTYALASLLAADALTVDGASRPLPAGDLLLLGGDQAYPYAAVKEYQRRFVLPFDLTVWHAPNEPFPRKAFLLPGNHDWYDGLSAFDQLFCGQRDGVSDGLRFGRYQCQQHRSYWAIRLPHDWWIWGLDIQLTSTLDVGQVQYFNRVAEGLRNLAGILPTGEGKAKIILCISTPSWLEAAETKTFESYSQNLQTLLNVAIDHATVAVVLAGDWHHYARYFNADHRVNLITSGGGGAYLAPTHQLKSPINVPWKMATDVPIRFLNFTLNGPQSTQDASVANKNKDPRPEAVYPSRRTSRALSWLVTLFPVWNPTFCAALGFLYWLMYWFYTSALSVTPICSGPSPGRPFCAGEKPSSMRMDHILIEATTPLSPIEHISYLAVSSRWQPMLAITIFVVFGLIFGFLAGSRDPLRRLIESTLFWLLHLLAMAYLSDTILSWAATSDTVFNTSWQRVVGSSIMMAVAGGILAGFMCGLYLFVGNRLLGTHADNAFSAIRVTGYKNFLRMRVTADELHIYPIGINHVPSRAGWRVPSDTERSNGIVAGYVPRTPIQAHLIEGPIVIRPGDIRQMTRDDQGRGDRAPMT